MNTIHKLLTVLMVLMSGIASAAITVLDQDQSINDATAYRVAFDRSLAQTFSIGITGDLSKISILLGGTGDQQAPTTVSIFTTGGDTKPNSQVWSQTFPALSFISGWNDINVSGVSVTQGELYAIVLTSTDSVIGNPDTKWLASSTGNVYTSGKFYQDIGSGWVDVGSGLADANFKTYITTIPETSSAFLGSMGVLFLLRRRR